MLSKVLIFVLAVVSHWQSYVTGGVVTGIVAFAERVFDWKMPKWAFIAVFGGVFLLVSFFLAWKDEYDQAQQVPVLNAQLQDEDKEIKELKEKPPQIQVNVPPSVVNIPPQMAYFGSTGKMDLGNYGFGRYVSVNVPCVNFSQTIPAENAECWLQAYFVDTKLNPQNQPIVADSVADKKYAEFEKGIAPVRKSRLATIAPGEIKFSAHPLPGCLMRR